MVLSVLVAMILTPALCATLLKPLKKGEHHGQKGFFAWFNQMFNRNAERYEKGVAKILHRSLLLDCDLCPAAWRHGVPVPGVCRRRSYRWKTVACLLPRYSCPAVQPSNRP